VSNEDKSEQNSHSIEFIDYPPLHSDGEYKFEVLDSGQLIGTACAKSKQDQEGKFWHLDDLWVQEDSRSQGYGTKLLNHVCEYFWSLDRLRIRVHPGNPVFRQTGIEELFKIKNHSTEEELDAMDREMKQAMLQPDFWEKQKQAVKKFDSTPLVEWYRKRGFAVDDLDGKHLWCYPD